MHIIFKNGLNAAKKTMGPGLLLQGFALTLVLLYYFHEPTHQALSTIPELQQRMGLWFPMVSTALFGGVIPLLFMLCRRKIPREKIRSSLLFALGFWAFNGVTVDLFYKGQALLFGNQPDVWTVIKKVCFDQFVFSVFWSAPYTVHVLYWQQCGYSLRTSREQYSRSLWTVSLPTMILSIWAVWLPTVAIVYSLPLALQFPLFTIVLCFWSLLLSALSSENEKSAIESKI